MKTTVQKLYYSCMLCLVLMFNACLKDSTTLTYKLYMPVTKSMQVVRSEIKSIAAQPITNAGKMFVINNMLYVSKPGKGIHVIDNTNPANYNNIAFINIPDNYDVAVKDNILYADCGSDLVEIDISNPTQVKLVKTYEDVFWDKRYLNNIQICAAGQMVVKFETKDTIIKEGIDVSAPIPMRGGGVFLASASGNITTTSDTKTNNNGIAGSYSRFAMLNNYLYAVTKSSLLSFEINNKQSSLKFNNGIGWNIETIYPFKNNLFIGSQTGMQIYSVSDSAAKPKYVSAFSHIRACDPVIADDKYAYLTVHTDANRCMGNINQLQTINIENLLQPKLTSWYNLHKPQGLGKTDNLLWVCDDEDGIKIFNTDNASEPKLVKTIAIDGAYDVICLYNLVIVTAKTGIYQYWCNNINDIKLVSNIIFEK